jgi:hypothetical protein
MMKDEGQPIGGPADPTIDKPPVLETDSREVVHIISLPAGDDVRPAR